MTQKKNKKKIFKALLPIIVIITIILSIYLINIVKENQKPLAVVNGKLIYKEDISHLQTILSLTVGKQKEEMLLELVIEEELLVQEAKRRGITVGNSEKENYFRKINISIEQYDNMIESLSKTLDISKKETENHIENQILIDELLKQENDQNLTTQDIQNKLVTVLKKKANITRYKKYSLGTYKTFQDIGKQICTYNNKPIIRLYTTSTCPHCKWISSVFLDAVKPYVAKDQIIAQQWDIDSKDNLLTPEIEKKIPSIDNKEYEDFAKGRVPFFSFGCKYIRIGNVYETESNGRLKEIQGFQEVIEYLINETHS